MYSVRVTSEQHMKQFGEKLGNLLRGGDIIELVGDVGAGKTTLTKGIARGLQIDEDIQSPSFTISRVYDARDALRLVHYDFYRLQEAGIMRDELSETLADQSAIAVIEWAGIVEAILPEDRLTITLTSPTENDRELTLITHGNRASELVKGLK